MKIVRLFKRLSLYHVKLVNCIPKAAVSMDLLSLTLNQQAFTLQIDYCVHRCGKLLNQSHEIDNMKKRKNGACVHLCCAEITLISHSLPYFLVYRLICFVYLFVFFFLVLSPDVRILVNTKCLEIMFSLVFTLNGMVISQFAWD